MKKFVWVVILFIFFVVFEPYIVDMIKTSVVNEYSICF